MATLDDAAAIAAALEGVVEGERHGSRTWYVGDKAFAWERPYSKADIKRFGDADYPREPLLAVRVADLHDKEAILAEGRRGVFTIPHFDGYAAVLIELHAVAKKDLRDLITDGWRAATEAATRPGRRRT